MRKAAVWLGILLLVGIAVASLLIHTSGSGAVPDDAKAAGKTVADFPQTDSQVFDAMDGGVRLNEDERKGRNTWILWTAGDQTFWDGMAQHGLGTADLLKTIDSRMRGFRFKD